MKFSTHYTLPALLVGGLMFPAKAVENIPTYFEPPTDIVLDNTTIAETAPVGELVGTFSTTDVEDGPNANFTYALVPGEGSANNDQFAIDGNQLLSNTAFDIEEDETRQIRVQTTDTGGEAFQKAFTITVTNVEEPNQPPADITLDNSTIAEDAAVGTPVGILSTADAEDGPNATFAYALVPGEGSVNNDQFAIVGNELQSAVEFDIDENETRSVRIQTTDAGGETFQKVFTLTITDVEEPNQPPTDIALTNSTITERAPAGTLVGTLSTTDAEDDPDAAFTYVLVPGEGSANNNQFTIEGNQLLSAVEFDVEADTDFLIRIQTTDAGGEAFQKAFTITVTNVEEPNQPPTDIELAGGTISEDADEGSLVGTLSTVDPDGTDTEFAYELVSGAGSADNDDFDIDGDRLLSSTVFDIEANEERQVRVRTTDPGGLFFEEAFTITITDEDEPNQPPTDITLDNATLSEDAAIGTPVGTLSTTDAEDGPNATFTYALVAGGGSANNGQFKIVGNELQSAVEFDVEENATRSVRIQTTDPGGATFAKVFTITITDVEEPNQPPTDIALTNSAIAESAPAGTLVGTFSTTDAEDGPNADFTYALVEGEGDSGNEFFNIPANGNRLLTATEFDIDDVDTIYQIRVQVTDSQGGIFAEVFGITVTNEEDPNQPPTDISLEGNTISEDADVSTPVGTLSTTDAEDGPNAEFTYTLVAGPGSANNAQFAIEGNELRSAVAFDIEENENRSVRIQTTDTGGKTFVKVFTITITDEEEPNQPPTDITLNNNTIAENQPELTLVGRLTTVDADNPGNYAYQKVGGVGSADNASFRIQGDSLLSDRVFDFETKASYQVRVRARDTTSENTLEKSFAINVANVDEAVNQPPTDIRLATTTVAENQPAGSLVSDLFTTDLDDDDGFTYALTAGEGDTDNASFRIRENQLLTDASFDFETKSRYLVRITTTDDEGASFAKAFVIRITDVEEDTNDAPTDLVLDNNTIAENEPPSTPVGRFTVEDPDVNDRHVVTLVEGDGDDDNGRFQIRNNVLYSLVSFDFEDRATYSIRVQGRDPQRATVTEVFTIEVTDVADNQNQPPTAILLSSTEVSEGQIVNLVVGAFSATDPNPEDTHTFSLVEGEGDDDNATFSIADGRLQTAQVFDFNAQSRYRIRVRADDGRGGTLEEPLTITVIQGENNAPTVANPVADLSAAAGERFSVTFPDDVFTDADTDDVLTYTVALADGSPLPDWLTFDGDTRALSGIPPEDVPDSLELAVTATDPRGATVSDPFTLTITRVTALEDDRLATWQVYPVPTDRRQLTVKAPSGYGPTLQFRLLDTRGRLVQHYGVDAAPSSAYVLPLPGTLSPGTYFLEIETTGAVVRKRIVFH